MKRLSKKFAALVLVMFSFLSPALASAAGLYDQAIAQAILIENAGNAGVQATDAYVAGNQNALQDILSARYTLQNAAVLLKSIGQTLSQQGDPLGQKILNGANEVLSIDVGISPLLQSLQVALEQGDTQAASAIGSSIKIEFQRIAQKGNDIRKEIQVVKK